MSVIEFPGREPPPEGYSEEYVDKLRSEAFRDLECEVHDLGLMGEIAVPLIMSCTIGKEDSMRKLELAQLAVLRLTEMLKEFEANYRKRWHNEPVQP